MNGFQKPDILEGRKKQQKELGKAVKAGDLKLTEYAST